MKAVYETGFFIDVKNLFSAPKKSNADLQYTWSSLLTAANGFYDKFFRLIQNKPSSILLRIATLQNSQKNIFSGVKNIVVIYLSTAGLFKCCDFMIGTRN